MLIRPVFLAILTATLVGAGPLSAAAPAEASVHGAAAGGPRSSGAFQSPAHPGGRIIDDVLAGVSCTTQPDNPAINEVCTALGTFFDGRFVDGLLESSSNGRWGGNTFGGLQKVTEPFAVSCVAQPENIPDCVAVGEHFTNAKFPMQLVSVGGENGFSNVAFRNPKGATWSVLNDVSCTTATSCLLVGSAGTTRRTAHGLRYLSHATAFRWTGHAPQPLKVPAPAHAKGAELLSVSCPSTTSCMAVGDFISAAGRILPYSALLDGSTWRVHTAPLIRGKTTAVFEGVSCPAPASCVAVGEAAKPGATAFAERYGNGRWGVQHIVTERQSAFTSVSCPTTAYCVAVGAHRTRPLVEAWNGQRWVWQSVPKTSAPFTVGELLHVSCVTATICTAVGFRHNPATRFTFHTLAAGWNGKKWSIQKTINE